MGCGGKLRRCHSQKVKIDTTWLYADPVAVDELLGDRSVAPATAIFVLPAWVPLLLLNPQGVCP